MNKKNRKTKGFSHRLVALLLCCACLFSVTPISAIALGEEAVPAASVAEAQPEEAAELQVAEPEAEAEPEEPAQQEEPAGPEAAEAAEAEEAEAAPAAETADSTPAESETAEADAESQPADSEAAQSEAALQPAESEAAESEPETEATEADKLYERLMACTTYEEMQEILNGLTEEEQALLDNFTEEQNAALEAKTEELGGYGIDTQTGSITIQQGSTGTVRFSNSDVSSLDKIEFIQNSQTIDNPGFNISMLNNGYNVSVASSIPTGEYTIRVDYTYVYSYWSWADWAWKNETHTATDSTIVKVTEVPSEKAQIYYLKTPTSDPKSNNTDQWGRNIGNGTVRIGNDVTWTDNNKNIYNPGTYVVSMATGMVKQADGSWLLPKNNTYNNDYEAIFTAYQKELEKDLKVTLKLTDIEAIYLTPYKISKGNGTNPDKHIDCTISVKTKNVFAAVFWVDMPNGDHVQADSKNYKKDSLVKKTGNAPTTTPDGKFPNTMDIGGITYKFVGWYDEDGNLIPDSKWEYSSGTESGYNPSTKELEDGTVNFYAHYEKAENELTIQKTVSGNMYDPEKEFTFTVSANKIMTDPDNDDATNNSFEFKLKKGESKKIKVPAGATVTVTENPEGYKHTVIQEATTIKNWTPKGSDGDKAQGIEFTMPDEKTIVVFNNEKSVTIDTGVVLDTLPYVLILAVVAGGAVLMVKKRGKRDSD